MGNHMNANAFHDLKAPVMIQKFCIFFSNIQNIDQGGITIEREMQEQYFYTHFRS